MPLINTSVPNLIQGVSQQPDAVRFDGQCEEQENALSSVVDGLKKRPNTRHVARLLGEAISADSFVHFINRSASEKYVVIHDGTDLRAFNILTGDEATINGTTSYLDASNPRESMKALTVGDSTFMLNNSKTVLAKTQTTPDLGDSALLFVKQGGYEKDYTVTVEADLTVPNVTDPALISITMTSYQYESSLLQLHTWWRHRITSVTVNHAGSGYGAAPVVFSVSSNQGVVTPATFTVTMNGVGGISSIAVNNPTTNDYLGSGMTQNWTVINGVNSIHHEGYIEPTLSHSITPSATTGFRETVSIRSGGSSSSANANSNTIAGNLLGALQGNTNINSNFTVTRPDGGSVLVLTKKATINDIAVSTSDSLSNTGLDAIYESVSTISDLPTSAPDGFSVKIRGDAELNQDDYYVRFETSSGQSFGEGSWVETVAPSIAQGINASTMPHVLINDGVDSFRIEEMSVLDRVAGDDRTNPLPSFVSSEIQNLFFFKNRLGFLSKENIAMSESGLGSGDGFGGFTYNFGRTTVTALLDSDPIDVSVSSSRVTNLRAAKGFQENLVLFSENGQFVLKGGDVLTPKTVSITPVTNFSVEFAVDPLPLGSYLYFPFSRGNFTGFREFTVNDSNDTYDSLDVTEHVPSYVPSNIIDMAGTTTEDIIALLSGDEPNALYIYKYFWSGSKKLISSWSKFTFGDDIRGIEFIDSTLYLVTVDSEANTHLLSLPLESGLTDIDHNGNTAGFLTLLDKRVRAKMTSGSNLIEFEQADDTYSAANADLPYTYFDGAIPAGGALLPEVFIDAEGNSHALKYENLGLGGQVRLSSGNASSTTFGYVGIPYTMKYKFSTQVFKAQSGNSASPTSASAMQVRNGSVFFDKTHTFDVKVTPDGRSEVTETFSADDRPDAETLGNRKFAEGYYKFPVHSKAKNVDIVIENDSPFDSRFSSAEFESFVHPRSRRYG